MTALTLLAVVPETEAVRAVDALQRRDAHIAVSRDLAGLAIPTSRGFWRTRKAIGKSLVEIQRALELVHDAAPVLPAAPGSDFADFADLQAALDANYGLLARGLAEYGELEQHQLVVRAPTEDMLRRLSRYPAWAAAQTASACGDRVAAGRILQEAAAAERARLATGYFADLAAASRDIARLPEPDDETILNVVSLVERGGDAPLERALEAFDAEWGGALRIRMVGPAPASSFAAAVFERPDPAVQQDAERLLGVAAADGVEAVRAAYRAAMKRAHPDLVRAEDVDAAEEAAERSRALTEGYGLLRRVAEAHAAHAVSGAPGAAPWLARLRREGDAAEAEARAEPPSSMAGAA